MSLFITTGFVATAAEIIDAIKLRNCKRKQRRVRSRMQRMWKR